MTTYHISIISELCNQYERNQTPEARRAPVQILMWYHAEHIPAARRALIAMDAWEQLATLDEMAGSYPCRTLKSYYD